MLLKLYDTLTRQKRLFEPLERERVRLYLCGPTVYDFAHIGNARPNIIFDVLFRLLRLFYGADHVIYARNITDVDDKINARAAREHPDRPLNETIRIVTRTTERQFHEDVDALGCLRPSFEPRATEHIDAMKLVIERLVASGNAYVAQEHVVFSVASMSDYGKLSRRSLDELIAGARVEVAPYKRNPMDFVLWKPSRAGEPAWPSPAGIAVQGRPGWHIECSAMSWKHLGEVFDIHGGGIDLAFPHHENEIAQSRCAFHTPVMANHWMHNGFLQVEGEKMSKSVGNFVTIRELLESWPGDVLRLNMLHTHYRQPIDWTETGLNAARNELLSWSEFIAGRFDENLDFATKGGPVDAGVIDALSDDLNTPLALSRLHHLFEVARREEYAAIEFARAASFLGFRNLTRPGVFRTGFARKLFEDGPQIGSQESRQIRLYRSAVANDLPLIADAAKNNLEVAGFSVQINSAGDAFVGNKRTAQMADPGDDTESMLKDKVQQLIALRAVARNARNFSKADRFRDQLATMGIGLKDSKGCTTWEIARWAPPSIDPPSAPGSHRSARGRSYAIRPRADVACEPKYDMRIFEHIGSARTAVPLAVRVHLLRQYGTASQAYSATYQEGLEHFGDERGFLAYKKVGRTALILSDPIAPHENIPDLISRFLQEHPDACFWWLSHPVAQIFAARRCTVNALGPDTCIDLPTYTFTGPKKKRLREAVKRMVRRGFVTRECSLAEVGIDNIKAVSERWRRTRTVRNEEVSFLNRPMVLAEEPDVRRFFTFDSQGKLVGFAFFDPVYESGKLTGYTSQHNRHLPEADSMIHFAIKRVAIETFQMEGLKVLHLGLAPFADVLTDEEFKSNRSWVTARYFYLSYNSWLVNRYFYSLRGIEAHRRAFRGEQRQTYCAFTKRPILPRILKLMRATKVM